MSRKLKVDYSEIDKLLDYQEFVESFRQGFVDIEDPRRSQRRLYSLSDLLLMIICAVIAGANSISHIHEYVQYRAERFEHLLELEQLPSYLTFWWLLVRLDPKNLVETFCKWLQSLPSDIKDKVIAIDGKRLRGASKNKDNLTHLVSAWETNRGMLFGQVQAKEKSNEITAIPELLNTIDIQGSTITIDAAGCQKGIARQIRKQGGHYLIALKGNQGRLHDEARFFFGQANAVNYEETGCAMCVDYDKGHGRIEERKVVVINDLGWLDLREEWTDLNSLVEVSAQRNVKGTIVKETRYYMSSLKPTPEVAGELVRGHWGIENGLHWSMDVVFLEDACQVSTGHAAENLATVRRIAQGLIKMDLGSSRGVAKRRREAAWDTDQALKILSRIFQADPVKNF